MLETLDICICTFRRESLMLTLDSVALQKLPSQTAVRVIVADNDDTIVAREAIVAHAHALGLALQYIHAPARNISIARNACLEAAESDWIVFIDDDEVATPDWIAKLLSTRRGAQIVFGKSQAIYNDPATPRWIVAGDFHSNQVTGNDAAWNGYTANVLIDRRFVATNNLKFEELLGQVGGEDTIFFFEASQRGARFRYAPDAVVTELTLLTRANFRWLALRRFRSGQVHYMTLCRAGRARSGAVAAVAKVFVCGSGAVLTLARPGRLAVHALRAALHIGVIASALGFAPYREYGAAEIKK
jgi:succinoglycan biosynthesis protein ExoM